MKYLIILLFSLTSILSASKNDSKTALLEYNRYEAKISPYTIPRIADEWYSRNEIQIALEFDHLYIQNNPYLAHYTADKWYSRGNKDVALVFDKLYVQNNPHPDKISTISDKWYNRADPSIALELEISALQNMPYIAHALAVKWYNRGDLDLSFKFDNLYLQDHPGDAPLIAHEWHERNEHDKALVFESLYPRAALIYLNKLIKKGNFSQAQDYGNQILEFWISQNDETIQNNIDDKLKLAVKMESKHYAILRSKLIDVSKDDIFHNYLKFLENLPLSPNIQTTSITDYLTHRIYINPDFLSAHNINIEKARMMLELDLYELTKKNDITFLILHAIALHAKTDPYFKLHIFLEVPLKEKKTFGTYRPDIELERVNINSRRLRSSSFRRSLIHEWTHQLMDILFSNNSNPYPKNDQLAKSQWKKVMNSIQSKLNESPSPEFNSTDCLYDQIITCFSKIQRYDPSDHDSEAIARFSEILTLNEDSDPRVKEFLLPIKDYWIQYIKPALNKYFASNSNINNFTSDWHRENVLDLLYRHNIDEH